MTYSDDHDSGPTTAISAGDAGDVAAALREARREGEAALFHELDDLGVRLTSSEEVYDVAEAFADAVLADEDAVSGPTTEAPFVSLDPRDMFSHVTSMNAYWICVDENAEAPDYDTYANVLADMHIAEHEALHQNSTAPYRDAFTRFSSLRAAEDAWNMRDRSRMQGCIQSYYTVGAEGWTPPEDA